MSRRTPVSNGTGLISGPLTLSLGSIWRAVSSSICSSSGRSRKVLVMSLFGDQRWFVVAMYPTIRVESALTVDFTSGSFTKSYATAKPNIAPTIWSRDVLPTHTHGGAWLILLPALDSSFSTYWANCQPEANRQRANRLSPVTSSSAFSAASAFLTLVNASGDWLTA